MRGAVTIKYQTGKDGGKPTFVERSVDEPSNATLDRAWVVQQIPEDVRRALLELGGVGREEDPLHWLGIGVQKGAAYRADLVESVCLKEGEIVIVVRRRSGTFGRANLLGPKTAPCTTCVKDKRKASSSSSVEELPKGERPSDKQSARRKLVLAQEDVQKPPSPNKAFGRVEFWFLCDEHNTRERDRLRKQRHREMVKERKDGVAKGSKDENKLDGQDPLPASADEEIDGRDPPPPVRYIVLFASYAHEMDTLVRNWETVIKEATDSAFQDVWLPTVKNLHLKGKAKKWMEWAIGDHIAVGGGGANDDSGDHGLSPLRKVGNMLRVIMGLPSSSSVISELVRRGLQQWKDDVVYREFIVVGITGHGGSMGLASELILDVDGRKHKIDTYAQQPLLVEAILRGVANGRSLAQKDFKLIVLLDWCNSMQLTGSESESWWRALKVGQDGSQDACIIGWLDQPNLVHGTNQLGWLGTFGDLLSDDALRHLGAGGKLRVVNLQQGKYHSERICMGGK